MQEKKTEFLRIFSDRIKALRLRRGLSQEQLADLLGVRKGTVGNWESGQNGATIGRIRKIAKKLNVSCEYLVGNADEQPFSDTLPTNWEGPSKGYSLKPKRVDELRDALIESSVSLDQLPPPVQFAIRDLVSAIKQSIPPRK